MKLHKLVVKTKNQECWSPLANEQGLEIFPLSLKANEPAIDPNAAHKNQSEGSFAVCCSMLRATVPSRCSSRPPVSGCVFAKSCYSITASVVVFIEADSCLTP
jgi:hypothetical protein